MSGHCRAYLSQNMYGIYLFETGAISIDCCPHAVHKPYFVSIAVYVEFNVAVVIECGTILIRFF